MYAALQPFRIHSIGYLLIVLKPISTCLDTLTYAYVIHTTIIYVHTEGKKDGEDKSDANDGGEDKSDSEDVVKTITIKFDGNYETVVGKSKDRFLTQCSISMAPVTCVDARPGSILVDVQGKQKDLTPAVSHVASKGLALDGFPSLELKGLVDLHTY